MADSTIETKPVLANPLGEDRPKRSMDLVWKSLGRRTSVIRDGLVATLVINTLALATALFTMQVYDRVIPNTGFNTLIVLAVGVGMALVLELILKQQRSHLMDRESTQMDIELTDWFFRRAQGIRMEVRPPALGTLAAQIKGLEYVRGMFSSGTVFLLADIPFALLFILVIAWVGGWLAVIPLILIPLTLLVGLYFQRRVDAATALSQGHSNLKAGLLVEAIDGIETVKSTGSEDRMQASWQDLLLKAGEEDDRIKEASAMSSNIAATLQQFSYAGIIAFGATLVVAGNISMGALIAAAIISQRALGPIARLPSVLVQWSHAKTALKVLDKMLELPNELDERDRTLCPEVVENSLRLERIEFSYGENTHLALELPEIKVQPGERIGVIGPIGSGKSTLLKIASGLYRPRRGQVFLGGLDTAKIDRDRLRELIAYLPQNLRLTGGTLRSNLTRGLEDPGDEALLAAAKRTGLIELINAHPMGLALPIAEGGRGLSGGQKQLVGFTRLLLLRPQVLLLDEPTASMDGSTEARVVRILKELTDAGHTLLLATHKTALLPLVDRLFVFSGGRLVHEGPREVVMAQLANAHKNPPSHIRAQH